MRFESKHDLGEFVFLFSDPEQKPRIITAIEYDLAGAKMYYLSSADTYSIHSEYEFSEIKNAIDIYLNQMKEEEHGN